MKRILVALILLIGTNLGAQVLKFKIAGLKDTTVHLVRYLGPKMYYADTTQSKGGIVQFDGAKHAAGMYAIFLPGGTYFEFIHDKEVVDMSVGNQADLVGSMKVNKSKNNIVFYQYILFMTNNKKKMNELTKQYDAAPDNLKLRDSLKGVSQVLNDDVVAYQKKLVADNPGTFIAMMVKMSLEIDLPEPPRNSNGVVTDSNFVYNYYIAHYWDNVDLKDPRIVNTPVYHNKLDKYFSQNGLVQIPDSIVKYAIIMLEKMDMVNQDNKVFQYTLSHITNKYQSSQIMGMDKIVWAMGVNYYCPPNNKAYWMSVDNTTKFCERVEKIGRTMIGTYASMIILTDTTETNWINMNKIIADYTILYFWDPNCGHCKKTTPKLQTLYEKKFKERGIEVYAVAKATGADFEAWKKFIRDNGLKFINVGLTKNVYDQAMKDPRPLLQYTTIESLNYSDTWDVYSTPRIFVLDKDKKIMFKQLSISQLEEIMDNLTGHRSDAKLFPIAEEDPEESGH